VTVNGQADSVSWGTSNTSKYLNSNGNFPSYKDMCQQGIAEAAAAKSAGTKIYVVAYGAANTSSGYCQTDSPAQNPCTVLKTMSSGATEYFFADGSSISNGCTPPTGGQSQFHESYADFLGHCRRSERWTADSKRDQLREGTLRQTVAARTTRSAAVRAPREPVSN
jgi:hypothetical protein